MWRRGLVPLFYNEEPFLDKPVSLHQLQAASMLVIVVTQAR
jgi:hypothetical protein